MPTSPSRVLTPGTISGTPVRSPDHKKARIVTPSGKKHGPVQDPSTVSTTTGSASRSNSKVKLEHGADSWY